MSIKDFWKKQVGERLQQKYVRNTLDEYIDVITDANGKNAFDDQKVFSYEYMTSNSAKDNIANALIVGLPYDVISNTAHEIRNLSTFLHGADDLSETEKKSEINFRISRAFSPTLIKVLKGEYKAPTEKEKLVPYVKYVNKGSTKRGIVAGVVLTAAVGAYLCYNGTLGKLCGGCGDVRPVPPVQATATPYVQPTPIYTQVPSEPTKAPTKAPEAEGPKQTYFKCSKGKIVSKTSVVGKQGPGWFEYQPDCPTPVPTKEPVQAPVGRPGIKEDRQEMKF